MCKCVKLIEDYHTRVCEFNWKWSRILEIIEIKCVQRIIYSSMELANVLNVKPESESVIEYDTWKALFNVKLTTNQTRHRRRYLKLNFSTRCSILLWCQLKKGSSDWINTRKLGVSCARLANYRIKLFRGTPFRHSVEVNFSFAANIEGNFLCDELVSTHTFVNKIKSPTTLNILKLTKK